MSFGLKIFNGDLVIDNNGELGIVENTEKLVQDVLKLLMTQIGANPFYPWYGSTFSGANIGLPADANFLQAVSENQIRSSLEMLQNLQREQSLTQDITASETLAAVKSVAIIKNQMDPTSFEVRIILLTKSLKSVETTINITL